MSERPDDEAGAVPQEGGAPPQPQDAPWWHEPHAGPGPWWGHGAPGGTEHERSPWPAGPAAGSPPGWGGGGAAGDPAAPGGWTPGPSQGAQGGHWAPSGGWGHPGWGAGAWGPPGYGPPQRDHRRRNVLRAVGAGVLVALALLLGVGIGYGAFNSSGTVTAGHRSSSGTVGTNRVTNNTSTSKNSSASGSPQNMASIAAKVSAALVDVNTVLGYATEEAAGTGMVLTSTGKVLTNNHVIEGATSISVTDIGNRKTYHATVLGYSKTLDIAVIQLKGASGLKTVSVGDSSAVKVGQAVVGIGNAGGTGGTPSVAGGSVTALDQAITASDSGSLGTTTEHLTGLIESDAHIQPGDSGGPLVDTSGQVVGMDTAASTAQGFSFQGAATGQGYSIPINAAMTTAHQIIDGRQTTTVHVGGTGFIGVYVQATSQRSGTTSTGFGGFGFTTTSTAGRTSGTAGVRVQQVIPNTPAAKAGITRTDVITSVAGTKLTTSGGLTKVILQYHPGDTLKVDWTTPSGQSQTATVTLANGPPD
jgi:S1-C subfamily serine protease